MIYDVAVVGGGLSGLVAALELAKKGVRVVVYEASSELGGFARTSGKNQEFDEHSWRSYGDFYTNLKHVVEQDLRMAWPTESVNLTPFPPVPFSFSRGDWKMVWTLLQGMMTLDLKGLQRKSWYDEVVHDLSPWGLMALGRFNKSGSDYRDIPVSTIVRVVEMLLPTSSGFRISPLPTHEYLIAPLKLKLDTLGVVFFMKTPVTTLNPKALGALRVISTIPPTAYNRLDRTGLSSLAMTKMSKMAEKTQHQEVSFRVFFKRCLRYPAHKSLTFDLHQSAWGLLIMPCDMYMTGSYWSTSVWSGTCTYMKHRDSHGRTPLECSPKQCQDSILEQILGCSSLRDYFWKEGVDLSEEIASIRLWKEWREGSDGKLQCPEIMSINSFQEVWSRPVAGSLLGPNIYLAGAHAGTGCDMWLMESATEAGKRAAIAVMADMGVPTDDVYLDKHERHPVRVGIMTLTILVGILAMFFF